MAAEPGQIDLHVHLASASGLADAAAAGITALRDAGTRNGAGLALRTSRSPLVLSAGWALHPEGGYGGRFGVAVRSRDDVHAEILKLKQAGAGIIKVMASGMVSLSQRGVITPGGFDRVMLEVVVAGADAIGLKVMAHANGAEAIRAACEAGVVSIEHGFYMTDAELDCMKRKNILWVPTVGALTRAAEMPNAPAGAKKIAAGVIEAHLVMVGKAFQRDVRLGIGTDCTLPDPRYREAYEEELDWFRKAGIPEDEVMRIANEAGKELLRPVWPRMNAN